MKNKEFLKLHQIEQKIQKNKLNGWLNIVRKKISKSEDGSETPSAERVQCLAQRHGKENVKHQCMFDSSSRKREWRKLVVVYIWRNDGHFYFLIDNNYNFKEHKKTQRGHI